MFEWKEYLRLADELSLKSSDEASRRAAISRAYYAAFCAARKHVGMECSGDDSIHEAVRTKLRGGNADRKEMAYLLGIVKKFRISADYRAWEDVTADDMDSSIGRAKTIFTLLESNPPD